MFLTSTFQWYVYETLGSPYYNDLLVVFISSVILYWPLVVSQFLYGLCLPFNGLAILQWSLYRSSSLAGIQWSLFSPVRVVYQQILNVSKIPPFISITKRYLIKSTKALVLTFQWSLTCYWSFWPRKWSIRVSDPPWWSLCWPPTVAYHIFSISHWCA